MQVLLLLAGKSTRFWPLAEKSLFPLCGTTLLEEQTRRLRAAGCKNITLVGGAHNLKAAKKLTGLPCIEQKDFSSGMRSALLAALPRMKKNEPLLVVSSNDVIDPQGYRAVVQAARAADGVLLAKRTENYFPGGYLTMEGKRVMGIVEKPKPGKEPSRFVTIVIHAHNDPHLLLSVLKKTGSGRTDGYELALGKLFIEKHYNVVAYDGIWQAVKYPWHMIPLLEIFLREIQKTPRLKNVSIHPTAVLDGPVIFGEGARVLPHATIIGPCTIGARSIIGNNCLVRGSSIGDDCVIGYGTEIKSSILAHHVWTHMAYIGESIIGSNIAFGGGSMTGNLRLDESEVQSLVGEERVATGLVKFGAVIGDGCRLGIHVSLQPGVKIGKATLIGSASVVGGDIPENSYVSMKNGRIVLRPNRVSAPMTGKRDDFRGKLRT
jgi:UDP-N-acetylglucosamine diphosphorylase / glucose-1-phosphate thymidylyltransferase / UDP-N-acetylgalactosamine diphosphorylase / glucosamine-1-phosphate N-acetyltransferase / galactosamine-1-phosphate N-acetyltransferase